MGQVVTGQRVDGSVGGYVGGGSVGGHGASVQGVGGGQEVWGGAMAAL